jgi:hypothetical protein
LFKQFLGLLFAFEHACQFVNEFLEPEYLFESCLLLSGFIRRVLSGFLLVFGVVAERLSHDHLPLGISLGLEGHFFHLLGKFFLIDFFLIVFPIIFKGNPPPVPVHDNSIFGIMLHLKVVPG